MRMEEIKKVLSWRDRRIGVILLLTGVCLPLALFPFAHNYHPLKGFWGSLNDLEIWLWETKPEVRCDPWGIGEKLGTCPRPAEYFAVPYRYPFALGVILFFSGLAVLLLPWMSNRGEKAT